ncbi:hypothetical protein CYY_005263 [Polysphondylium violaceum]|uniref:Transmembrane protein n=1 Tax=Polysphondylium violaceum TaxID=133409 RepID=A0A8J4PUJ0_9MYCE|nr:hypothetical protein CYY_005263 [Polysphondylium violaceum]
MSSFDSYDWENDKNWKQYLDNTLIPPGTDPRVAILKLQHKYYKRNINPDYEIPANINSPSPSSPQPPQHSSNTTHQRTNTTSNTTSNTNSNSNSNNNNNRQSPPPPQQQQQRQQNRTTTLPESSAFFKILKNAWIISQGLVVIFGLGFLLSSNPTYYYRSFLAAIISYLVPLFHSFEGQSINREMFNEVIKNENAQYLITCVLLYFLSGPVVLFLIPIFIFSFYHVIKYVNGLNPRQAIIQKVCTFFIGKQTEAINMATTMEITNMLLIVFGVFTGTSSIFLIFAYYRLLKLRYQFSTRIQNKCHELSATYDYMINTRYCPVQLRPYLMKFKRFFSS